MIFVSLALLSLAACVTDFTPEVKGVSGILVVDGTITDGVHLLETFDIRRDRQPQFPEKESRRAGDDPCVEPCGKKRSALLSLDL